MQTYQEEDAAEATRSMCGVCGVQFSCALQPMDSFTMNVRADIFSWGGGVLRFGKNGRSFPFLTFFARALVFGGCKHLKNRNVRRTLIVNDPF